MNRSDTAETQEKALRKITISQTLSQSIRVCAHSKLSTQSFRVTKVIDDTENQ